MGKQGMVFCLGTAAMVSLAMGGNGPVQMITDPDSVYRVTLISTEGAVQDYQCKGYRERGDKNTLNLYFTAGDYTDRMLVNLNGYVSVRIRKETAGQMAQTNDAGVVRASPASYAGEWRLRSEVMNLFERMYDNMDMQGKMRWNASRDQLLEVLYQGARDLKDGPSLAQPPAPYRPYEHSQQAARASYLAGSQAQEAVASVVAPQSQPLDGPDLADAWKAFMASPASGATPAVQAAGSMEEFALEPGAEESAPEESIAAEVPMESHPWADRDGLVPAAKGPLGAGMFYEPAPDRSAALGDATGL